MERFTVYVSFYVEAADDDDARAAVVEYLSSALIAVSWDVTGAERDDA